MSYSDQVRRNSPGSIAAVVGIHALIGYALVSGLAYNVISHVPLITVGQLLTDPPPPPPHPLPITRSKLPVTTTVPLPTRPDEQLVKTPDIDVRLTQTLDLGKPTDVQPGPSTQPEPPARPNLARGAVPAADRLRWITTEDYPTAALRQNVEGVVVVDAEIGADGRVQSCAVVQSSGSALLDTTTCRLYTKRAHFTPALDADGKPIAAHRTDRFRWQIPND